MHPIWQEMAKEFNKVGNQEVVIAEVNCEKERDLCYGKVFVLFSEGNKCSLFFRFRLHVDIVRQNVSL